MAALTAEKPEPTIATSSIHHHKATLQLEDHEDISIAPIEPHTAAGPGLLLEETGHASDHDDRSTLIFKRLRRDMKPAGPWLFAAMT